jgi:hypothetical protein
MASKLDDLPSKILAKSDAGLSFATIKTGFAGKSREREAVVREKLATLVREGAIWGPFKYRGSQLYFATGRGPSIETASQAIVSLVSKSGVKLLSKAALEKKVTGMNARFFVDGIKHAVASRAVVELSCGKPKYYLHRDVAAEYFGFEDASGDNASRPTELLTIGTPEPSLTLKNLLPVYRRLKAEQGGFSAVKIFDLMKALDGSKEDLHRLLVEEAKAGRVTIHPTTSVELPAEVIEAGIRLPGFPEPFVTVVVKNEP